MNDNNNYGIDLSKIKFDTNFYKTYHSDLKNLNDIELTSHFILHGYSEKRLFYNLENNFDWLKYYIDFKLEFKDIELIFQHFLYEYFINYEKYNNVNNVNNYKTIEINNKIQFNENTYKSFNPDLKQMNNEDLINHYNNHGRNEKRKFMEIIPEFNWCYYLIKYNIKNKNTINDLWNYYVYDHIKHSPNINFNMKINYDTYNLSNNQNIIYNNVSNNFNNNSNKSQNFNNFPLTGIIYVYYNRKGELRNETNLAFFIRQTVLKDTKNIYMFIINNYTTEIQIPVQQNVIIIKNNNCFDIEAYGMGIKNLLNRNKSIQRIVLMNSGVTGPFYNTSNWLSKFEDKIQKDRASICSTINYKFQDGNYVPGYFVYIVNKPDIIKLLSTVLIRHGSKSDVINKGEYGISRVLRSNKHIVSCLIDNNIKGYRGDRDSNLNRYNLYDLVFVKTNWRSIDSLNRDSCPIKNNECINEINKICNFKYDRLNNINYNNINICNSSDKWNSKSQFYNTFGIAEEFIVHPNMINSKKLAVYCHSDRDNLFRSFCIDAVNTLTLLGYKVIICTTCYNFKNVNNLPFEKIVISNAKNDCFMFKQFINSKNIQMYDHLLFVNDTIIFPVHGINNMRNTFNKFSGIDFWGIWSSPEQKEHIMSPFLYFSNKTFNHLKSTLNKYSFADSVVAQKWEVNLLQEMKTQRFSTGAVVDYRSLGNINYQCPIMHPDVFPRWINRPEVFAIKWKYMGNYLNKRKLNIPYMNYLLRYLHFNHTGMKGKPEEHRAYGNPINYCK